MPLGVMARTKAAPPGETVEAVSAEEGGWITPSFWNALPHFLPLMAFPMVAGAAWWGGWWIALPFAFLFANNFDSILGIEKRNMNPAETTDGELFWYKMSIWIWAALWPTILVFTLWQIFVADRLSAWEDVLLVMLLASMSIYVFTVSHEFIHRRSVWERRVGEFILASVSFPLSATEHVYIHHSLVCTPGDHESAPRGESFWRFYAKNLSKIFLSSWRYEQKRLKRRLLPGWHYKNAFWRYFAETALWFGVAYAIGGIWAILILILLGNSLVFQLRLGDYIQHYGFRRIRLPSGRFEPVQPHHTWNASYRLSNWLFYNTQRHPDHHMASSQRYPLLQYHGEDVAPQLPGTYLSMMGLALFPSLWFKTMDPLLDKQRARFYPQIKDWRVYDSPAFAAQPAAFDQIAEILSTAPRLAEWIERSPEILDSLQTKEFTDLSLPEGFGPDPESEKIARRGLVRLYWTRELGMTEMKEQLADFPVQDASEAVEVAREWSNGKALQIGVHAMRGNLTPAEAAAALSRVAEASVSTVLSAVCEDFAERRSQDPESGLCAVALKDLADGNMLLGAELDVFMLYEGGPPRHHERLARHFSEALRAFSRSSLLFLHLHTPRASTRLRSLAGFREYHQTVGSAAELLDLTRTRCIFATTGSRVGEHFEEMRRETLALSPARSLLIEELLRPRPDAAPPNLSTLEEMRGGIRDLERAARFLTLKHVEEAPDMADPDAIRVFEIAEARGLIPEDTGNRLREATRLWQSLRGVLPLVAGDDFTIEASPPEVQEVILQAAGVDSLDALTARIREIATRAVVAIEEIDDRMPKNGRQETH